MRVSAAPTNIQKKEGGKQNISSLAISFNKNRSVNFNKCKEKIGQGYALLLLPSQCQSMRCCYFNLTDSLFVPTVNGERIWSYTFRIS
jgi:hypothetical protein